MKYHFYSLAFSCIPFFPLAQTSHPVKTESFRLSLGYSNTGTGDMHGVAMEAAYVIPLANRLDLSTGFGSTIHFQNEISDHVMRMLSAGLQLTPEFQYSFASFSSHSFQLIAGGLMRFQTTSMPEMYSTSSPTPMNPYPSYTIDQFGKQNTFSVGYRVGLAYMMNVSQKWETGLKAVLQNDTNADVITQLSIVVGRRMNHN